MNRICQLDGCGKELINPRANQKFCGSQANKEDCSFKARILREGEWRITGKKVTIRHCQLEGCGKELDCTHSNQKYCGNQSITGSCSHKSQMMKAKKRYIPKSNNTHCQLEGCGKLLHATRTSHQKYCGNQRVKGSCSYKANIQIMKDCYERERKKLRSKGSQFTQQKRPVEDDNWLHPQG